MKALRKARRRRDEERRPRGPRHHRHPRGARGAGLRGPGPRAAGRGAAEAPPRELKKPKTCYVCKEDFTRLHFFYDALCPPCAELNYEKRFQTASLDGPRRPWSPGARVKIGFQAALKMLRAGARVIATTRFPHDAAAALRARARLRRLEGPPAGPRPRPAPLADASRSSRATSSTPTTGSTSWSTTPARPCGGRPASTRTCSTARRGRVADLPRGARGRCSRATRRCAPRARGGPRARRRRAGRRHRARPPGTAAAAASASPPRPQLSQVRYAYDDETRRERPLPRPAALDADLQQVDLRAQNTWRLTLAEVPTRGDARGPARQRGRALHPLRAPQAADAAPSAPATSTSSTSRRWRGSSRAAPRPTSTRTRTWRRPRST